MAGVYFCVLRLALAAMNPSALLVPFRSEPSTLKVIPEGRVQHSSAVRHEVILRDQSQCTAILPNGTRCEQSRFLDIHHKIPLSNGGTNHPNNLALLCNGHHRASHITHEHHSPRLRPR